MLGRESLPSSRCASGKIDGAKIPITYCSFSLEHTHPPLQRPHGCSHTPAPTHTLSQTPLESLHTSSTSVSYTRTCVPSPPSPALTPRHPCEPAPALLSTRDWPTRIRMLDARMDRQKFSKMMERSDFMNLGVGSGGHSGHRQKS